MCLHTDPYGEPGAGDVGGMNVFVRHTAEAMGAAGHSVQIYTRRSSPSAPGRSEPAPGVVVHRLDVGPPRPVAKSEHEELTAPFAHALDAHHGDQVLHSHHWFSGIAALPLARERGIIHAQSFHSIAADPGGALGDGESPESAGRPAGERYLARNSDLIVAVSRAEATTATTRLGADPKNLTVVVPGVDTTTFTPATAAPEHGPGYAVVAARLEPLKGIDLAITALAEVPAEHRPQLRIVGGPTRVGDGYPQHLRDLARRVGVSEQVHFTGPMDRERLAATLREARMLLVTSHSETYGLIALEAAASGIPVVAVATGGLVEAVADGVSGVLVPHRSAQALAEHIGRFASDPGAARAMGTSAREYAMQRSWASTAAQMLAGYARAIDSAGSGDRA